MVADMTNRLFEEQIRMLRNAYVTQLPSRAVELSMLGEYLQNNTYDATTLYTLHRIAHGLSGSGATYGFTLVSETSGRLDRYLQALIEAKAELTLAQRDYAITLVGDVVHALALVADAPAGEPSAPVSAAPVSEQPIPHHVFVCDPDRDLAETIASQIVHFGYTIDTFTSAEALQQAVTERLPAAIIADIALLGAASRTEASPRFQAIPLIFTAPQDDFVTRLEAVRAGGAAFVAKPIDAAALVDTLDALTAKQEPAPYRVLIIEDQALLAATYAATLRHAGMTVATVTDPLRVMASLAEFLPDVLLLDMYMPGCTGTELATVLRQQAAFASIPIVFLSAETQIDRQMEALQHGGDDFLTKPIHPDHLITTVTTRAHRARRLRLAAMHNTLDGLGNHTATTLQLKQELARRVEQQHPVTFAVVRIDDFSVINDNFGHTAGSRVIKSLARLLLRHLHKGELVGRYGDEALAIVLPERDGSSTLGMLDELRERFTQVYHGAGETTFTATFSCGIASFPPPATVPELLGAAERALLQAQHNGCNRIVLAAPAA